MQRTDGAIPIEQWKPDALKIVTILAEILGRQEGCEYEVVPANPKDDVDLHDEVLHQVIGACPPPHPKTTDRREEGKAWNKKKLPAPGGRTARR